MEILQLSQFKECLQSRPRASHKGLFGHVLVVGGDYGYSGAARLAAEAALRVGAGLVSVATRPEHALAMNSTCPELMCHDADNEKNFIALLAKATVIIVGPGLGKSNWAKKLLIKINLCKKPLIIDADALNILAEKPKKKPNWILTPHPGEAARLLKTTTEEIQRDRLAAIQKLQTTFGGVCILKGAGTLIAAEAALAVCEAGNPGMATAGMGDVLSGVIGGLVAQGIPLVIAAKLGVLVHAMAGDLCAKEGERGMMASDLMPYLRRLMNERPNI